MKKDIMEKWVAALRSGEYEQIDGRLRLEKQDGAVAYCCLGVLCDLHRREINPDGSDYHYAWGEAMSKNGSPTTAYANHADDLPHSVKQWAGIKHNSPSLCVDAYPNLDGPSVVEETELVYLNDDAGWTFEAIADAIEEQWPSL